MRTLLFLLSLFISTAALAQDDACKAILAMPKPSLPASSLKPDCDSEASYFGIGKPVDYKAALACAAAERASNMIETNANVYLGPGVLALIYANANGVPRNLPLARRFACEDTWIDGTSALKMLDKIEHSASPPTLDLCDFAETTPAIASCANLQSLQADALRNKKIAAIRNALPPEAQRAFDQLKTAEANFDNTRLQHEIDLTSTGRAIFVMNDEAKLRDQFLINLNRVAAPTLTEPTTLEAADRELNDAYKHLQSTVPLHATIDKDNSTVDFAGIQATQRAWLPLRDAWRAYAIAIHASAPSDKVVAMVTAQRAHQLKMLAP